MTDRKAELNAAAEQALASMDQMLTDGEWYCAQERADALRAALQPEPPPREVPRLTAERIEAIWSERDALMMPQDKVQWLARAVEAEVRSMCGVGE